tara:strand:+ start:2159 stop:2803 length:645 start_codon:yes stop_codon:yes gene_type:complete
MIKKIKVTFSEKLLFTFLIILSLVFFSTYFLLKDKCLFVNKVNPDKLIFKDPKNIAIMNIECGNVIIELYPEISPNAVKRFKTLIKNKSYDGSAFYKVIKNTLVQAGDLEFGNINNLNYTKIGTGNSGLGSLKSELNENFEFLVGSVALARKDELDTEDSEFFIILKEIPIYQGEYTPVGKVIYGLDALQKIKLGNKSNYVLRPDYINYFKLLD